MEQTCELSLNRRIVAWKAQAREAQQHAQAAIDELAKAETALRNMDRQRAAEKARADRAEAALRSLGIGLRGAA